MLNDTLGNYPFPIFSFKKNHFFSTHQLLQGFLYFSVPQTIDEGIDHWGHNSVEDRKKFIQIQGMVGSWYHIRYNQCPIENGNYNKVRGTSGNGLLQASGGWEFEDGCQDINIGHTS